MSQASSSLVSLARQILKAAETLEQGNPGSTNEQCLDSRRTIISATHAIRAQVFTGAQLLESHQVGYQNLSCLAFLVRFNIFTHVPLPASSPGECLGENAKLISYTELSKLSGVPLSRLQTVARMATANGLFVEAADRSSIAHTPLSASFAMDESLRDWVTFMTSYSAPMAAGMAEATARWGETEVKHHTSFNVAFKTDTPWFDYVKATPGLPGMFAGYMRAMSRSDGLHYKHLVDGYGWAGLGSDAIVVDVGGSTAQASIALAKAFPELRFIVQDLPEVVANGPGIVAEAEAATSPEEGKGEQLSSRIKFVAHNFFEPQPKSDGGAVPSVYLLRKILHDWPVARARDILQHLAVALRDQGNPQARVVIMDTILPPSGALGSYEEASLRVRDLTMAQCFNSKERELSEWEELLASTEPKLVIKSWKNPVGSSMAVIEAGL